jgi:hypothetical protein
MSLSSGKNEAGLSQNGPVSRMDKAVRIGIVQDGS